MLFDAGRKRMKIDCLLLISEEVGSFLIANKVWIDFLIR